MSYSVYFGDASLNITSNVSQVFYDHMDGGLPALDGLTGKQSAERLDLFWARLDATRRGFWRDGVVGDPKMCAEYDPPNGWGSLVGAIIFAGQLTAACARYPRHRVSVSY